MQGPRLKLERARVHIDALKSEVAKFLQTQPYSVTSEDDPVSDERLFREHIRISPPEHLSPLIGDCVHNLRSSLDHLVSALARRAGLPDDRTFFPICSTLAAWKKARLDLGLKGLTPAALDVIEKMQPYHSGADPEHSVLYVLHNLWNYDKHRAVVVTGSCLAGVGSKGTAPGVIPILTPGIIGDGTVVVRVPAGATGFEGRFDFAVAFGSGSPEAIVGASATNILSLTHDYINDTVFRAFVSLF